MNACLALDLILVIHESYENGKNLFTYMKLLQMDGVLYSDNQL